MDAKTYLQNKISITLKSLITQIEKRLGIKAPKEALTDKTLAERFIAEHKDTYYNLPTLKELKFAELIARQNGLNLDSEVKHSKKLCAEFIDAYRKPRPATKKQIAYLELLSKEKGEALKEGYANDKNVCSSEIQRLKSIR